MDIDSLTYSPLFKGMGKDEIEKLLRLSQAEEKTYQKGEAIFHNGQTTTRMGLVLNGSVTIESNDVWGKRTILHIVGKGQLFAETYALLQHEPLLVDVNANEASKILFLKAGGPELLQNHNETWVLKYLTNILAICAYKNLHLSSRSFHTAPKTIRGRVMAYLNSVALQHNANAFAIPFDRQQLADYLNLERSALSKELGKMQRDGLITVQKNHFEIHKIVK